MSQRFSISHFIVAAMLSSTANAAPRPSIDSSGRVSNLSDPSETSDCATASGRGRVVSVKRGVQPGIVFRDRSFGQGFINVIDPAEIKDGELRRRIVEALSDLLRPGQELSIVTKGCGAAGRVEHLDAVGPAGSASKQKTAPSDRLRSEDPVSAQQNALSPQNEAALRWRTSDTARGLRLGIPDGNHYTTIWFDCGRRSQHVSIVADDPGGRYATETRQRSPCLRDR